MDTDVTPERWIGRDRCAIAGVGSTAFTRHCDRGALSLAAEATLAALADAGLSPSDVDGIVRGDADAVWHNDLSTVLGMPDLSYWGIAGPGGSGPCAMVGQAVAAILSGQATTVVAFRVFAATTAVTTYVGTDAEAVGGDATYDEFFAPYGVMRGMQAYALIARRHMIEMGSTAEHLGHIAVTCRERAIANPGAQMRKPLTLDQYLDAPMISDPLRLNDCCLQSYGAVAVVVTGTERARDLRQPPALIAAVAQGVGPAAQGGRVLPSLMRESITSSSSSRALADRLYRRAGIGPTDVDVAQLYDCFTISVLLQLADYGFCTPQEAGPFAASGALDLGGSLPINTSGGNLSEAYINGATHLVEGARQVRGDSTSQVAGAEISLVTSGPPIGTSAMVLRRDV